MRSEYTSKHNIKVV